ncbi:MAG: phosphodiesterase, MJ0936 family protein [Candidatus Amesbacteria bacterium GW2011_GWB1_47_26]|uniref:Phosphoesterase n=1 Tax=Candidatus Amesbacteria bacterium GW2011_GWC2_45_19 TaxID=1618366 RepID=A0A0G1PCD2_9BACT|nr:MAG: phosphodiesterase, MJ0936 family protein [Candidatus Amesbacteria bacterium GW2011_GWC2_45_19]KKU38725.1 MAG: phosphodiesterase, MJ0936 family protein [Candidatus Amesbacteria bacterium GW2011_GWA1_46_35]KKU69228.1 MAG: phosphodiesterase, MJ0936 family protein [Microgenomates group bacterium GW2011_GWC1_47_20]KKU74487.1 MAG: phosphodiesterase, MJ0936 family protein [Candidatus Amesbacteria bacterium GW2011_GWB1_47_26]KKU78974.1 MAG: phosphodiesterase, MJ0936 family protein [Candidatus A
MKIAVLSDTHDHIWNLRKAIQIIKEQKCEVIIFCGDFCAPFTAVILAESALPIYACFGNNDEDQFAISEKLKAVQLWPLTKEFAEVELESKKIAFCHYPKLGKLLAGTGDYDAVFHGHTHKAYQEQVGKTLLANPGSICGIISGKLAPASFGIYDTLSSSYTSVSLLD